MDRRLRDASLKLERARLHLADLRADIRDAGRGEPYSIPLRKEIDDGGILRLLIADEITRPEKWGPMIGDALHNLRSALDSGWWQLAIRHLKRLPSEKEGPQIQFPISKPGEEVDEKRIRKWVGEKAAQFVQALHAATRASQPDVVALEELRRLSNEDKHRNIHVAVHVLGELRIKVDYLGDGPSPDNMMDMSLPGATFHPFRKGGPKPGDEVLTIPPECWIRRPEFEFDAFQAGFISIDGKTNVVSTLDHIQQRVSELLDAMQILLQGDALEVKPLPPAQVPPPPPPPNSEIFNLPREAGPPSGPIDAD